LRHHRADTEHQRSNNHDNSLHQFDPSDFSKRTVNGLPNIVIILIINPFRKASFRIRTGSFEPAGQPGRTQGVHFPP
jgi:hypothetical protein